MNEHGQDDIGYEPFSYSLRRRTARGCDAGAPSPPAPRPSLALMQSVLILLASFLISVTLIHITPFRGPPVGFEMLVIIGII